MSTFIIFRDDIQAASEFLPGKPKALVRKSKKETKSSSAGPSRLPLASKPSFKSSRSLATLQAGPDALPNKENVNPFTGERTLSRSVKEKKGAKKAKGISPKADVLQSKTLPSSTKKSFRSDEDCACSPCPSADMLNVMSPPLDFSAHTFNVDPTGDEDFFSSLSIVTDSLEQIMIDARCYELTVSPLADISPAYDSPSASIARGDNERLTGSKNHASLLPNSISDFGASMPSDEDTSLPPSPTLSWAHSSDSENDEDFSWPLNQQFMPLPSVFGDDEKPAEDLTSCIDDILGMTTFTTPERERIYSGFALVTPEGSPSRSRPVGVDCFGDIAYRPN
ncbi:hypothetical protein PUNSTDRAFT_139347 [Punctularia strigosozonata HHB-11173 SS5]|uniref:Uncharacterized protein n=1 Tax=Punctularia strigosozonata (strain HHB-11173) TaxID=741275 RepID=R7RZT8_PUNST|nr:uncharacterized protein PUNSTDRAFT_139347 [Punctularia strigosozonata HHB-11173 SS5]EIN03630.1 hypothetical protein PUNSTDRAFT_139347 [Punctularia strigosozonata HHB-11173 SS5]